MPDGTKETQTSGQVSLGVAEKPKIKKPDTSLNPDIGDIKGITETLPHVKGQNPYHVKKRLLKDQDFFKQTTKKMYFASLGGMDAIRKADPEKIYQGFQVFKKNFRKYLRDSSFAGEDISETLVNRSVKLTEDPTSVNASELMSVVKNNKKKYPQFFEQDGTMMYDGEDTAFATMVAGDKKLHRSLQKDRYSAFEKELEKYHNDIEGLDSPEMKTKAWVVYDKQGPQGLTKFINKAQKASQEGIDFDPDEYLRNTQVGKKTLGQYYENFVVGDVKDTKYGNVIAKTAYRFNLNPSKLAALTDQESSFNPNAISSTGAVGITQMQAATARENGLKVPDVLYKLDVKRIRSKAGSEQRKKYERLLKEKTEGLGVDPENDERYDPEKELPATGKYLQGSLKQFKNEDAAFASYHSGKGGMHRAITDGGKNWIKYTDPDTRKYINKINEKQSKYNNKTDGGLVFSPTTPRKDVTEDVPKDLNSYSATFMDKNGHQKDPNTSLVKYINSQVPQINAKHFNVSNYIKNGDQSDEAVMLAKATYKQAKDDGGFGFNDLLNTLYANSETTGKDKYGDQYYQIDYNHLPLYGKNAYNALQMNPDTEYLFRDQGNGIYRIIPNRKQGAKKELRSIISPFWAKEDKVVRHDDGTSEIKTVADTSFLGQVQNSLVNFTFAGSQYGISYFMKPIMNGLNAITGDQLKPIRETAEHMQQLSGINVADLDETDKQGWAPKFTSEVAPSVWFMGGLMGLGGVTEIGVGKTLLNASKVMSGANLTRMGQLLEGGEIAKMGERLIETNNKAAKFYLGGAATESLIPKKESLYNILPELVGKENNAVTNFYNTASKPIQVAMGIGASLGLDLFVDSALGASKFVKDSFAKKFFNKNEFKGFKYGQTVKELENGKKVIVGAPKVTDKPVFTHEIRRLYHELADGLAEKPMREVGSAMAEDATKGTLNDFTKGFTDNLSPVASNVKTDIRDNLRKVEQKFGKGTKLSEEDMDTFVQQQYDNYIEGTADNLHKILKESSDRSITARFAKTLEDLPTDVKEFKVGGKTIDPEDVGYWRNKGKNLIVKDGKVFEADPKFWTLDLADRLKKMDIDETKEALKERKIREAGIDPNNLGAEGQGKIYDIHDEIDNVVGKPTKVDGSLGYVSDFDKDNYIVRTADGEKTVSKDEFKELGDVVSTGTGKEIVPDEEFKLFRDEGKVSKKRINDIANRIIKGEKLDRREFAIYQDKGKDIEKVLNNITKKQVNGQLELRLDGEHIKNVRKRLNSAAKVIKEVSEMDGKIPFC